MAQRKRTRKKATSGRAAGADYPTLQLLPEPAPPQAPLSDRAAWEGYAEACLARARTVEALIAEHSRQRLAASEQRTPLDFRGQHRALADERGAVVERVARQIPDAAGRPGQPHRVYDTLATLFRNGSIDRDELEGGRRFEEQFRLANLDPLHAANPARIRAPGPSDMSNGMIAGRDMVGRAMTALGGSSAPAGAAVWAVLGLGQTVKEFAQSAQLGGGRSLDEKVAKGIFVGALGVLAVHYGLKRV